VIGLAVILVVFFLMTVGVVVWEEWRARDSAVDLEPDPTGSDATGGER
jgi:CHASE2 domain-containing sensor protein